MVHMVHDPDGPGIPAHGIKTKERKPRKKKPYKPLPPKKPCPYNEGVECRDFKCDGCGFNPERNGGRMADCKHEFVYSELHGEFVCEKCFHVLTKEEKREALEHANALRRAEEADGNG